MSKRWDLEAGLHGLNWLGTPTDADEEPAETVLVRRKSRVNSAVELSRGATDMFEEDVGLTRARSSLAAFSQQRQC